MATTYEHVRLSNVDENGNVDVMYPVNTGDDVSITPSANTPESSTTVQKLVNNISSMAFENENNMLFLGYGEIPNLVSTDINDDETTTTSTWSSDKLNSLILPIDKFVNDGRKNFVFLGEYSEYTDNVYDSDIHDNIVTPDTMWSSDKISKRKKVTDIVQTSDMDPAKAIKEIQSIINEVCTYRREIRITTFYKLIKNQIFNTIIKHTDANPVLDNDKICIRIDSFPTYVDNNGESWMFQNLVWIDTRNNRYEQGHRYIHIESGNIDDSIPPDGFLPYGFIK